MQAVPEVGQLLLDWLVLALANSDRRRAYLKVFQLQFEVPDSEVCLAGLALPLGQFLPQRDQLQLQLLHLCCHLHIQQSIILEIPGANKGPTDCQVKHTVPAHQASYVFFLGTSEVLPQYVIVAMTGSIK